jgi:uncharacterized protein (DUF885 family)
MRDGLKAGVTQPRAVMEKVLPQLQALAVEQPEQSLFWGPIKNFPDAVPAAGSRAHHRRDALLSARVLPAYRRAGLRARRVHAQGAQHRLVGAARRRRLVCPPRAQSTTLALTPDEIHAIGLKEVARILGEMEGVRQQVGFQGDLKAFFKYLQDDPQFYFSKPEDLLAGYRELQKKINGLTPKLFDIAPRPTTRCARSRPSAPRARRRVLREAGRRRLAAGRVLREHLQPQGPAHLRHGDAVAARGLAGPPLPDLHRAGRPEPAQVPPLRQPLHAYVEGWALYAESLGKELGLFTDPYQWYGRLSDEQLRAMRLVVDTGLHAKGWSREQAIRYMLDNSSMAESDIVSEVERYIVWPGQALGYKIGQRRSPLRREAESRWGEVRHQGLPPRRADRGPGAAAGAAPAGAGLGGGAPRGPQRRLTVCAARATVCRKPLVTRAPAPRLAPSTSTRSTR